MLLQNYEVYYSTAQIKNLCLICIDRTINTNKNYVIYCTNGINSILYELYGKRPKKKLWFPLYKRQHIVVLPEIFSLI
jgi:hypothetical protein